jgi:hypothetical protein
VADDEQIGRRIATNSQPAIWTFENSRHHKPIVSLQKKRMAFRLLDQGTGLTLLQRTDY